ncbi:M4 family metallopeptidase, partial [Luteimonas panaciterrae]|uniref:M4 family metallopeptidase n=1 Tax=Luteimonas panaciterrae TaxID=363885 RepID=UPI001CFAD044
FFDNNPKDPPDYLIGEGVMQDGKPYRYMFKPSLDGESPDCYDKKPRFDDPHSASGVGNHFFYLLSEGAVVPASYRAELVKADLVCNGDIDLTRITNKVAAQVWYRAITLYMTSQTGYPKAR